jgi:hypothetical protein
VRIARKFVRDVVHVWPVSQVLIDVGAAFNFAAPICRLVP